MSGPGDIDGEVSGDEAAWRDLIARFDVPADPTSADVPWPAREDLPDRVTSAAEPSSGPAEHAARAESAQAEQASRAESAQAEQASRAESAQAEHASRTESTQTEQTARTESPPGAAEPTASPAEPLVAPEPPSTPVTRFYIPADRMRVIRPAGDPRSYTPAEEEDEPYKPAPLPPPAKLDSVTKAALAGVVGGPGYLLVASIFLHWTVSAEAAFIAVAAFVAGFVTLIVKLGDRSGHDGDDDGAVL